MTRHDEAPSHPVRGPTETAAAASSRSAAHFRNGEPIGFETELGPLAVSGRLPTRLRGMLLRNGPHAAVSSDRSGALVAGAMLHAFTIDGGEVRYWNRCVHQPSRASEVSATAGSSTTHPPGAGESVLIHAARLLLFDGVGPPRQVTGAKPAIVGMLTTTALGTPLPGPNAAHGKLDPMTGELLAIGRDALPGANSCLRQIVMDGRGQMTHADRLDLPFVANVHDFAMSQKYLVIPTMSALHERTTARASPRSASRKAGTRIGILQRGRLMSELRWIDVPDVWITHVMNAWDDEGAVHVDLMEVSLAVAMEDSRVSRALDRHTARLSRWTVDVESPILRATRELLCELPGDFPRMDDRYAGSAHRHGWFAGSGADGSPYTRVVHVDHHDGCLDTWALPPGWCASEPVFVPGAPDAAEGEGWLLCVAFRGDAERSDLLVFDSLRVHDGPSAAAHLPHRVPNGTHGCWIDGDIDFDC